MSREPRIFIVSNRLPVTLGHADDGGITVNRSSGGLVAGLGDVHKGSDAVWIGHSGVFEDDPQYETVRSRLARDRYDCVPLTGADYDAYYSGVSNGAIWPLFHYFPGYMAYKAEDWLSYVRVNQRFAEAVLAKARPGDKVWVHDYQLMLVPGMLRHASPDLHIAYFHHIPFPSSEIFRIFPQRHEILQGLLGADLIGFHTLDYVRHFLTGVTRILGGDVDQDYIHYQRRRVHVGAFPLGVDVESTHERAMNLGTAAHMADLSRSLAGKTVFLGIDRLDYTKGIPERLQAFRLVMKKCPDLVGRVIYLQVCVPSRQDTPNYAELRSEVERMVGQINGEFGRPGYMPIHYLYQPFTPDQVTAFYRLGDIALVTPLRDGLNLVCKEYVASRIDDDGVLVLSEFAGAAAEMGEAILVNPFDVERMADSLLEAVQMAPDERKRRMQLLRKRVTSYNNLEWSRDFMRSWDESTSTRVAPAIGLFSGGSDSLLDQLQHVPVKRLFLDYDGTLTPIKRNPGLALPAPALLKLLADLGARQDMDVTIITGRSRKFCDRYFGGMGLHLVAEHCAFYRRKDSDSWHSVFSSEVFERIKALVLPHLESFVRRIPGAFVEEKETALVLHYREAEPIFGHSQALELKETLVQLLAHTPYSAFKAKKAIEIKPAAANKATAVEEFLQELGHDDEVFVTAGDDLVDEDMFRVREERNLSIHVGHACSVAKYTVDSPVELQALLSELAESPYRVKSQYKMHQEIV